MVTPVLQAPEQRSHVAASAGVERGRAGAGAGRRGVLEAASHPSLGGLGLQGALVSSHCPGVEYFSFGSLTFPPMLGAARLA